MPSEFDILAAEFCSPTLVEQFGERDAQGDLAKCTYRDKSGASMDLVGCILHNLRVSDEFEDAHGTNLRDEIEKILEVQVPRLQGSSVFTPQLESKFITPDGDSFTIQEIVSLSPTFAHLRMTRSNVTAIRRNGAVRE